MISLSKGSLNRWEFLPLPITFPQGILDWGVDKNGVLEIPGRSVKTISKKEILYPKNHGISKLRVWRSLNPAIQIQTPL